MLIRTTILLLSLLTTGAVWGQLGVRTAAVFNRASTESVPGIGEVGGDDFQSGAEVAVNYWFRLPNQRIEFLPALRVARSTFREQEDRFSEYGLDLNVNIYPFDFGGDCDCPTFGKQGPQLQKGFFVQLSGGYALYDTGSDRDFEIARVEDKSSFTAGGAIGIDFGLSNLLTLTPIAGVRYGLSPYQEVRIDGSSDPDEVFYAPQLATFHAGIQLSFRFDHRRY